MLYTSCSVVLQFARANLRPLGVEQDGAQFAGLLGRLPDGDDSRLVVLPPRNTTQMSTNT